MEAALLARCLTKHSLIDSCIIIITGASVLRNGLNIITEVQKYLQVKDHTLKVSVSNHKPGHFAIICSLSRTPVVPSLQSSNNFIPIRISAPTSCWITRLVCPQWASAPTSCWITHVYSRPRWGVVVVALFVVTLESSWALYNLYF